jgi:hypothetical protein
VGLLLVLVLVLLLLVLGFALGCQTVASKQRCPPWRPYKPDNVFAKPDRPHGRAPANAADEPSEVSSEVSSDVLCRPGSTPAAPRHR